MFLFAVNQNIFFQFVKQLFKQVLTLLQHMVQQSKIKNKNKTIIENLFLVNNFERFVSIKNKINIEYLIYSTIVLNISFIAKKL